MLTLLNWKIFLLFRIQLLGFRIQQYLDHVYSENFSLFLYLKPSQKCCRWFFCDFGEGVKIGRCLLSFLQLILFCCQQCFKHRHLFHSKKYMPPPLPYFKVNIYPFPLPHFASVFFAYLWPFADPIISLHSRDISLFDCHI